MSHYFISHILFFHLKVEVFKNILATTYDIIEPSHGKTNNVVSDQVRHKSSCTVTEAGWKLEISDLGRRGSVLSE